MEREMSGLIRVNEDGDEVERRNQDYTFEAADGKAI